jgi:histidinol-phosphate aminotransferase
MVDSPTVMDQVRSLIRPEILALSSYHVADAAGLIKLDAMENPFGWPEEMVDEWLERLREAQPNRYPEPSASRVEAALRRLGEIPDTMDILFGNGSDELIQILLIAVAKPGARILAPEPTFVMYRQIARCLGLEFVGVPLRGEDFGLDMSAMRWAIHEARPAIVFLAYPNNPTGNRFAPEQVREIIDIAPGLVVVDEAYAPFAGASFLPEVVRHERLLVLRTLSKLGLAGLRLGYLVGAKPWLQQFDKVRLPYNINVLTQLSVEFALERIEVLQAQVRILIEERESLSKSLAALRGVQAFPSHANFITFRLLEADADAVVCDLLKAGVLVKNLHSAGGSLRQCLRVTVGTPEENRAFLHALGEALRVPVLTEAVPETRADRPGPA